MLKRGRMEGFIVLDYSARQEESVAALSAWLAEGKLTERVNIKSGLENAPMTLHRLFEGINDGKQLLRVVSA